MHVKIPAFVCDDEGNEQPIEILLDAQSFSVHGPEVTLVVETPDGHVIDDHVTFTAKPPFKPYQGWRPAQYERVARKEDEP